MNNLPSSAVDSNAPLWICYCDFDGIVHFDGVYSSEIVGVHMREPGHTLFEWMPILEELLEPYPTVKIVLSTSWVRAFGFEFAKSRLSKSLQSRVIGATFDNRMMQKLEFDLLTRGAQVGNDLRTRKPDKWLILDDDANGWSDDSIGHLVLVDGSQGLSDQAAQTSAREILSKF